MNGRVDGLIVMSPHADAHFLERNLPATLPAVLVNTGVELPGHARYLVDNFGGAQAMTRHLVASGRQRIAFIGGVTGNHEAQERLRGYRAGLPAGAIELVETGDFTEAAGHAAGRRLAQRQPRPDAIFAANDMMAIGCLSALREAGLRVPQDMALTGFDDIPISRYVSPALTTIRVPIAELGAAALDTVAKAVNQAAGRGHATTVLPVDLVIRQSCGAGPPPQPSAPAPRSRPRR
jgi:LacI family transcriptional regulator